MISALEGGLFIGHKNIVKFLKAFFSKQYLDVI